jgi:hypothetical protein
VPTDDVRADEDPVVHSELFRRVSEGLMKFPEYHGEMMPDMLALMSGHSPEPVRVVKEPPSAAEVWADLANALRDKQTQVEELTSLVGRQQLEIAQLKGQLKQAAKSTDAGLRAQLVQAGKYIEEIIESRTDADLSWYLKKARELRGSG